MRGKGRRMFGHRSRQRRSSGSLALTLAGACLHGAVGASPRRRHSSVGAGDGRRSAPRYCGRKRHDEANIRSTRSMTRAPSGLRIRRLIEAPRRPSWHPPASRRAAALRECRALGSGVPRQISVIGCGATAALARCVDPQLTSVRASPASASGQAAADCLIAALAGREFTWPDLPLKLVIRESAGAQRPEQWRRVPRKLKARKLPRETSSFEPPFCGELCRFTCVERRRCRQSVSLMKRLEVQSLPFECHLDRRRGAVPALRSRLGVEARIPSLLTLPMAHSVDRDPGPEWPWQSLDRGHRRGATSVGEGRRPRRRDGTGHRRGRDPVPHP